MNYYSLLETQGLPKWPYPVEYGEVTADSADVLVVGGGMAGCFAAIHAAKMGASVIVVEKGATVRSGAAGAGIDHWMFAATNPASTLSPDRMLEIFSGDPFCQKHMQYVVINEAYEALLDLESFGVKVRDAEGDFVGAPFRDQQTGLLFAYDYDSKYCIRLFGGKLKPALYKEMKRLGIKIYDRVMCTSLLTQDGRHAGRVIGATGLNVRTGRFYTFNAKATLLATAKPLRLWDFGTERVGSYSAHDDPNCAGDGDVMAWRAGAKLMMMERTMPSSGSLRYPAYATGNASNTWYPANLVDSRGKAVRWMDRDSNYLTDSDQRCRRHEGQEVFIPMGMAPLEFRGYALDPQLPELIRCGEYVPPFYADLTDMPAHERSAIFGVMLTHEGKTRVPLVRYLGDAGFDPSKDMLQANIVPPEAMSENLPFWMNNYPGCNSPNIREVAFMNYGGLIVDWDARTSLEGLYAAGNQCAGVEGASTAAAMGRYCGKIMSEKVKGETLVPPNDTQVAQEMKRVYAPLRNDEGLGWKEVQIGLCRIMQDYAGQIKTREIMEEGVWWLDSIRKNELDRTAAANPHELARILECDVRLTAGEIILQNSLARTWSTPGLSFERMDYPEYAPDGECFVTIRKTSEGVKSEKLPFDFWLKGNYAPTYMENYLSHCVSKEAR